jgi:hypothetical protein
MLDSFPREVGPGPSPVRVGFITYDRTLHFYNLNVWPTKPHRQTQREREKERQSKGLCAYQCVCVCVRVPLCEMAPSLSLSLALSLACFLRPRLAHTDGEACRYVSFSMWVCACGCLSLYVCVCLSLSLSLFLSFWQVALSSPQMLVVADLDDVAVPLQTGLLVGVEEGKELVLALLDSLPAWHKGAASAESALGAAIQAAIAALVRPARSRERERESIK